MTGGREMETRQKLKIMKSIREEGGGEEKSMKGCLGLRTPLFPTPLESNS